MTDNNNNNNPIKKTETDRLGGEKVYRIVNVGIFISRTPSLDGKVTLVSIKSSFLNHIIGILILLF